MSMTGYERTLAAGALREQAAREGSAARSRRLAGQQYAEHRAALRREAADMSALAERLEEEPLPLLGAGVGGYTVIAAVPLFPGSGIPDYIVAASRVAQGTTRAGFGTWHASCAPGGPWLFEGGKYFTAADETADALREASRAAMLSLAQRCGAGLCTACGGPVGDTCWRCA